MNDFVIGEAGLALLKMKDEIASSVESVLIAKQIKQALIAKNWTKAELARQLEVKPSMVTKYLRGSENFTLLAKHKLQRVLGVKLGELASENESLKNDVVKMKEIISQKKKKEFLFHLDTNTRTQHLVYAAYNSNNLGQTQLKGIIGLYKSIDTYPNEPLPISTDHSFLDIA